MPANTFGDFFSVTTFGESRSIGIGAVIDGCPSGLELSQNDIQLYLNKRKPTGNVSTKDSNRGTAYDFSTHRCENDICEILSGVYNEKTLGTPIAVLVRNSETSSKNYDKLKNIYRPAHADYAYEARYGIRDYRGGGRSSGRETIGRVIGGAIAKKVLDFYLSKMELKKIEAKIWVEEIAGIKTNKIFPDTILPDSVFEKLSYIAKEKDSVGCILCAEILNVPEGLGSPVFNKLDACLAKAIMSIGAVKGFEIGEGFKSASFVGSENNRIDANYAGGICGGISASSKPNFDLSHKERTCSLLFRVAVKAPPSIAKTQVAFNSAGEKIELSITGQHDVCLFPRIVPVIESMTYITLLNAFLESCRFAIA